MPTNRVPVRHSRKFTVTDEMVALFKTGLEILQAGDDERFEDDSPPGRRREFVDLYKRLNWTLLRRDLHHVSVFDPGIAEAVHRLRIWLASTTAVSMAGTRR